MEARGSKNSSVDEVSWNLTSRLLLQVWKKILPPNIKPPENATTT